MILSGVEVSIVTLSNCQPREEYVPSRVTASSQHRSKERHVEAVDGERFAVAARILPEFDWHGATALDVRIEIDGGVLRQRYIMSKSKPYLELSSYCRMRDGVWQRFGLAFGKLESGMRNYLLTARCAGTNHI